jgi:hypothetical protein
MTLNAFKFWHIVKETAATKCVDIRIWFFHGQAIKDSSYAPFREAIWAAFGGHRKTIKRGTDTNTTVS